MFLGDQYAVTFLYVCACSQCYTYLKVAIWVSSCHLFALIFPCEASLQYAPSL